ncbi:MAG: insulinase family protein [Bdellovibrionales bacterium]|nr:insulinase family protein [Bdellovibrionales bacterium]
MIQKINDFQFGTHYHLEKYKFDNGLQVILFPDKSVPVFAYHTWFHVGSRNEREGITGIAHFFEHLMFKETTNFKEGEFDRKLEEAGGKINAATYVDWTFYRQSLPIESFDMICELESDRMQNVILSQKQLDSEREVVANERRFRVDNNPTGVMYEELYKLAFTSHPYHWPVIGWMKDIESINLEDCMTFYKQFYAPNYATIVVVGDIDTQHTLQTIDRFYGKIPSSKSTHAQLPKEKEQTQQKEMHLELELSSPRVLLGYKVPQATHRDLPTLELLQSLLFQGRSSRLYRRLVHTDQIATHASGWVNHTKDPGLFIIDVALKKDHQCEEAIAIIDDELQKIVNTSIPKEELQKCKTKVETSFWEQLKTVDDKAQSVGFHETVYGDYRMMFEEVHQISSITSEQIQSACKTYLRPENRTIIKATPKR